MTDDSNRIPALDFLRGLAVMGITFANVVAMGLPSSAQAGPFAGVTHGPLDLAAWTFNFLFVDGTFRALFAMMLGASMLLVMEAVELDGRDGFAAHRKRMIWLALLGLAFHLLLWSGDLLLPLALAGLIATSLAGRDTFALVKWALGLLVLQWAINLTALFLPFAFTGLKPGGGTATEVVLAHSSYAVLPIERGLALARDLMGMALFVLPGMLAFAAFGMAMLKGGFLAAQWSPDQYRATWRRGYFVGLVPMSALAAWVLIGRGPSSAPMASFGWSVPLRLPLAAAHAALAMAVALRFSNSWLIGAVRAVGRLALSNALLFSLVAALLFRDYGADLFARFDRAVLMALAAGCSIAMLLWSAAWCRWMGQGPAEWLWRRLARSEAT